MNTFQNWETILHINEQTQNTKVVEKIMQRIEYLTNFINDPSVPNILLMIQQMITSHLKSVKNPQSEILSKVWNAPYPSLAIGENKPGTPIVIVTTEGLGSSLSFRCGNRGEKDFHGPSIDINSAGYNSSNWEKLLLKGVYFQIYNFPLDIAQTIIVDFNKVNGEKRGDIIRKCVESREIVGCYPKDHWIKFYEKQEKSFDDVNPGINEFAVWTLEKSGPVSVFGNANGYHHIKTKLHMDLRVERIDQRFQFPIKEIM